jgi:hypothetical protein
MLSIDLDHITPRCGGHDARKKEKGNGVREHVMLVLMAAVGAFIES